MWPARHSLVKTVWCDGELAEWVGRKRANEVRIKNEEEKSEDNWYVQAGLACCESKYVGCVGTKTKKEALVCLSLFFLFRVFLEILVQSCLFPEVRPVPPPPSSSIQPEGISIGIAK